MKIIFISVTAIMFLYTTISAAVSDSFWTSAPMIIGAITIFFTAFVKGAIELWKFFRSLKKVTDDTHTLVNSAMGLQLKVNADLADFKAFTTKKPEDIIVAHDARLKYEDHVTKQKIVDAGEKTE